MGEGAKWLYGSIVMENCGSDSVEILADAVEVVQVLEEPEVVDAALEGLGELGAGGRHLEQGRGLLGLGAVVGRVLEVWGVLRELLLLVGCVSKAVLGL